MDAARWKVTDRATGEVLSPGWWEIARGAEVRNWPRDPVLLDESASTKGWTLVSSKQLAEPQPPLEFLVSGVWPTGSHGVVGGEKKTLKSYNEIAFALATASGLPYLGQFNVPFPSPVVYFVGEGGKRPFARRYQRIANAMGLTSEDLADLPFGAHFEHGPLDGPEFKDAIWRALDQHQPSLICVDPLYPYHPGGINSSDLYERGRMLAELGEVVGHGVALRVVDHFRKTGNQGLDLDSIAQAGMSQWVDSWSLLRHRPPTDVAHGLFNLECEFGSRQWGSERWNVRWNIGAFDLEHRCHVGDITWEVEAGHPVHSASPATDVAVRAVELVMQAEPFTYTRDALARAMRGNKQKALGAIADLLESGVLILNGVRAQEGERRVLRDRVGLPGHAGASLLSHPVPGV